MKHLKTYEKLRIRSYWLLSTNDYEFEIGLEKLNCPKEKIKNFINNKNISKNYYVFICCNSGEFDVEDQWGWMPYKNEQYDDFYERHHFKYMGKVEITPEEIENCKIKQTANKYNL
jgi:hypothetical protein